MNTTRVNKDNWFHHIRCTDVTKIPIYNNLEQVGDEPGMEGDIILRRDTQEFCYHDGTTWICIKAGGEDVTLEDACLDGVSLVADGIGPTLLIKGLLAGTGITLQDGSCVTITNSEPASSVTLRDACDLCATGETSQTFFKVAGGSGNDQGLSVSAIVNAGADCVYVTGEIRTSGGTTRDFDGNTVTGIVAGDIFVAKLASDGTQVFFKVAGGDGFDEGFSVSAIVNGANDCVYVTGRLDSSNPRDFDGNTVTGYGGNDIFVAKLASDGTQVFFKIAGGTAGITAEVGASVSAIVNGTDDCVYVTGAIITSGGTNPRDFDGNTVTGYGGADIFVAKLASDGSQAFFKVAGGSDDDSGISVSAVVNGANDCVYVTGFINTDPGSSPRDFDGNTVTGYSSADIFVAKLASDGTQVFFKVAGGSSGDSGASVSAIVNGGTDCVYVTGAINTTSSPPAVDFDGNTVTGYGDDDIFVAKLASDGSQVFFKVAGGTSFDLGISVSAIVNSGSDCVYVTGFINTSGGTNPVDFNGNTVTGYGSTDIFVAKLASDGSQVFFKVAGGTSFGLGISVSAIVHGAGDCVYVTGTIITSGGTNPRDFDGNTVTGYGTDDIFLAKLASDGTQIFFKVAGGTFFDSGSSVSAIVNGANECVYVTGFINTEPGSNPRDFDGNTVIGYGSTDIFVAKLTTTTGGVSLVADGDGPDLLIKGLLPGDGITLSDDGSCVTISTAITLANACGTGINLVADGVGPDLAIKGLTASDGIVLSDDGSCVNIATAINLRNACARECTQTFFKVAGGSNLDEGFSVSAIVNGANDCVYVTGRIDTEFGTNPVDFDGNTVTGFGSTDIFVAKLASDGSQVFFKAAGGSDADLGLSVNAIVNGANDCVYVTGSINTFGGSAVDFDGNTIFTGYGLDDIFVAKLASDGSQVFFKVAGGTENDSGLSVSAIVNGGSDCVYVTGYIRTSPGDNPRDFDGNTITGYSDRDIFVAKLSSDGTQVFFKVAGGSLLDEGLSVSAIVNGASDCVYVTGNIDTSGNAVDFEGNTVTGYGSNDIFVAKLASDGTQVFFKVAGGTDSDQGNSVSAIVNGVNDCVYVTGPIRASPGNNPRDFDGNTVTGFGSTDIFVAKLASDGSQEFFKVAGGSGLDRGVSASAIDNGGSDCVYVTGVIDTSGGNSPVDFDGSTIIGYGSLDIFVAKLASDGSQAFFKVAGGSSVDSGESVSAIVNSGNDCVYVTGFVDTSANAVDFDGNTVTGFSSRDIFIAKLTSDGSQACFKVAGGSNDDSGLDVSAIVNGGNECVYITGYIDTSGGANPVDFDGNTVTGYGDRDIFVAKLTTTTVISLVANGVGPNLAVKGLIPGDGITLSDDGSCVTITNTATLSDACDSPSGVSLVTAVPNLSVKGLIPGTGIALSDDNNCVTITNTGQICATSCCKIQDVTVLGANEITQIILTDAPSLDDQDLFWLFTNTTSYYFWYNKSSSPPPDDPDPDVPAGAPATKVSVEVIILPLDVALFVAATTRVAINSTGAFTTPPGTGGVAFATLFVVNNVQEVVKNAEDGDASSPPHPTGFTITTLVNGTDQYNIGAILQGKGIFKKECNEQIIKIIGEFDLCDPAVNTVTHIIVPLDESIINKVLPLITCDPDCPHDPIVQITLDMPRGGTGYLIDSIFWNPSFPSLSFNISYPTFPISPPPTLGTHVTAHITLCYICDDIPLIVPKTVEKDISAELTLVDFGTILVNVGTYFIANDNNQPSTDLVWAMTFNDGSGSPPVGTIPGPKFETNVGDTIIINFTNKLPTPVDPRLDQNTGAPPNDQEFIVTSSSIHPHGIELNNFSDGTAVSQNALPQLGTYKYTFITPRPGLYFYHPHIAPLNQVHQGLYGPIIVRDCADIILTNADIIPTDVETIILSDMTFIEQDSPPVVKVQNMEWNGLAADRGFGTNMLINGKTDQKVVAVTEGQGIRLQFFNASIIRYFVLSFDDGTGTKEVTTIVTLAAAAIANADFFWLFTSTASYYFWYNIDGGGADPTPAVPVGAPSTRVGTQVPISAGDSAATVATKTTIGIDGLLAFFASAIGDTITVINTLAEAVKDAIDGAAPTGFTISTITQGVDPTGQIFRIGGQGGLLDTVRIEGDGQTGSFLPGHPPGTILLETASRADVVVFFDPGLSPPPTEAFIRMTGFDFAPGATVDTAPDAPQLEIIKFTISSGFPPPSYTIAEGDPLRTHPLVCDPVENIKNLPTGSLVDPSTLVPPQPGSTDPIMTFDTGGPMIPTIDGVVGDFDAATLGDFRFVPHIDSSRFARISDVLELAIQNITMAHHPYHLHGFTMQPCKIEEIDGTGTVVLGLLYEWDYTEFMDVINIPPLTRFTFRIRIDDRPNPDGSYGGALLRWLFHCHIFRHAARGMISELVVLPKKAPEANP